MKKTLFFMIAALLFIFAVTASAQSLKDNPDYQKALEYQKLAEEAMEAGEYDKAYEYAVEAGKYSDLARDYANKILLKYNANALIVYVDEKLAVIDKDSAESQYPDQYNNILAELSDAKSKYDAEDYQGSIDAASRAKDGLDFLLLTMEGGTEPVATAEPEPEMTPEPQTADQPVYPKYYKVRRILTRRDCLWNIAGYSFIYNNPFKWRVLYEANKSKLKNPKNPRLILPDQLIEIPSLRGEFRDGTYDPAQKYPAMEK